MRISRFTSFTLGALFATVSLGAVTYANASSNSTIKACANKKTGAMRYITKGSCKNTETSLNWNQMGPQGPQGISGPSGVKGDSGTAGVNGQNLYVVDSSGQTLGKYLGVWQDAYMYENNNRKWIATPYRIGFYNFTGNITYYSDSQCTNRLIFVPKDDLVPTDATYVEWNSNGDTGPQGNVQRIFIPSNSTKRTFASYTNLYQGGTGAGCSVVTSQTKTDGDMFSRLVEATEIVKPSYTPPLSIVAR